MMRRGAAQWLARLQSGRNPDDQAKFEAWYAADPAHRHAFDSVRSSYDRSALLRHSSNYLSRAAEHLPRSTDRRPFFALAVAAILALVPIGMVLLRGSPLVLRTDAIMLKTNIGEIRRVGLSDGSSVTLDTSSRVEILTGSSTRRARVKYGRARFEIAPSGKPFVVEAGNEIVTATQGIIDVDREGPASRVDVLSGTSHLQIRGGEGGRQMIVRARERAVVGPGKIVRAYKFPAAPDWTLGMLQFEGMPLSQVAKLANRYSDQQIRIDGDLGDLRVTGAFRAGDTAGLAKSLAAVFNLNLHRGQDDNWHLAAANHSSPAA